MNDSHLLIIPARAKPVTRVEICRSFYFRVNRGNYEHSDYFASQKSECAIEDAEEVSAALYAFCKSQVLKAIQQDMAERRKGVT